GWGSPARTPGSQGFAGWRGLPSRRSALSRRDWNGCEFVHGCDPAGGAGEAGGAARSVHPADAYRRRHVRRAAERGPGGYGLANPGGASSLPAVGLGGGGRRGRVSGDGGAAVGLAFRLMRPRPPHPRERVLSAMADGLEVVAGRLRSTRGRTGSAAG